MQGLLVHDGNFHLFRQADKASPPSLSPSLIALTGPLNEPSIYPFMYMLEFSNITPEEIYKQTLDLHQLPTSPNWIA